MAHYTISISPTPMLSLLDSALGGSPSPVASNIQSYLAQASLPKLRLAPSTPPVPTGNHKSRRNHLAVRPERHRRLRLVHRIKRTYVDNKCLEFIQKHIPSTPVQLEDVDPDAYEQACIPCAGYDVESFGAPPLRHIDGLRVSWLEDIVLRTLQAVLRMIPEYRDIVKDYSFTSSSPLRDHDHKIFQYFMWERSADAAGSSSTVDKPIKLILAYQPPWILSDGDLKAFVDKKLRRIPTYDFRRGTNQERYNASHKLWAKLWDVCKQNNCFSFVLTNYNQWVFGGFTKGWENGYTMGMKEVASPLTMGEPAQKRVLKGKLPLLRTPSVLEYLTYWTVSSMSLPDHFVIPSVPDEIDLEMAIDDPSESSTSGPATPTPSPFHTLAYEDTEYAESEWSVQNSDVATSAGVRIGFESDSGETPPPFLTENWRSRPSPELERVPPRENARNVKSWLTRSATCPSPAPAIPRAPSPVGSEWSVTSLAMHRPRHNQGFFNIHTIITEEVYEYDFTKTDAAV